VRSVRFFQWVVVAALAMGGLTAGSASAATPAKTQMWIGQVQRQGGHFDYVGQPCPTDAGMLCANYVARYRIEPRNRAAAKALRDVAGGEARLRARFRPSKNKAHPGTLLASSVEAWCPPGAICVPPPAGHTVKVEEAADGSSVTLAPGDHLQVTLHSTYWQFGQVDHPSVLAADGAPQTGPGTNCPAFPGSGCGTVTQTFTALRGGTAKVSAARTTCGEALACSPAQHYTVTVHVH
jgi:hypothetical protein